MDSSREADLLILRDRMHDSKLPLRKRAQAEITYHKIREQLKDRKLQHLRFQLIRSIIAGDGIAKENITERMIEYELKKFGLPEGVK